MTSPIQVDIWESPKIFDDPHINATSIQYVVDEFLKILVPYLTSGKYVNIWSHIYIIFQFCTFSGYDHLLPALLLW